MKYKVKVYVVQGMVEVEVIAKSEAEAGEKAMASVEAEAGYHGNYPPADRKYIPIMGKEVANG